MTPCVVCQSPEHRTGDHVWTEEDGAREVAALSRPATDHGITNAMLRQEHTPRPATDPAGLDALIASLPSLDERYDARYRQGYERARQDLISLAEQARRSVADGPGPEERLRETAQRVYDRFEQLAGGNLMQDDIEALGAALAALPVHREETSHEPGPRATVLVEDQERPLIWIEGRQDD